MAAPIKGNAHKAKSTRCASLSARRAVAVSVLTLGLAGCAAYGPGDLRPGDRAEQVLASMGAPTAKARRPDGGWRWVYARGPMGRHTWMLDLGPDGLLAGWTQVLGEDNFARVVPGMREQEIEALLGPPGDRKALALGGRRVWWWRYPTFDCKLFMVTFDAAGLALDAGYGPDPDCEANDYPS